MNNSLTVGCQRAASRYERNAEPILAGTVIAAPVSKQAATSPTLGWARRRRHGKPPPPAPNQTNELLPDEEQRHRTIASRKAQARGLSCWESGGKKLF